MTQETPRKYTKSPYTQNYLRRDLRLDKKKNAENDIRRVRIINWRQVAQDRKEWRRETREAFILTEYWNQRRGIRRRSL